MENKTRWHKLLIEITGDFDNKGFVEKGLGNINNEAV
jgi:hypothetical protein